MHGSYQQGRAIVLILESFPALMVSFDVGSIPTRGTIAQGM
nr:MAG TPA: hypothetical protein [Caudoviricetes sp.]